jgi:hypothetical protein
MKEKMENIFGAMEMNMKEIGKMKKSMEKVYSNLPKELITLENGNLI